MTEPQIGSEVFRHLAFVILFKSLVGTVNLVVIVVGFSFRSALDSLIDKKKSPLFNVYL